MTHRDKYVLIGTKVFKLISKNDGKIYILERDGEIYNAPVWSVEEIKDIKKELK